MFLGKVRSGEIIKAYGADRILFGTDFPMWTQSEELERFSLLDLDDRQREKILSGNAKKILNI